MPTPTHHEIIFRICRALQTPGSEAYALTTALEVLADFLRTLHEDEIAELHTRFAEALQGPMRDEVLSLIDGHLALRELT